MRERPLCQVPKPVFLLLFLGFMLQIACHLSLPRQSAKGEQLPPPPSSGALGLLSLGEPIALSKVLMLYLQSFDSQPGISIPLQALDYSLVRAWLTRIIELDPIGQYPLLAASRIYGEVSDRTRQRQMLDFIHLQFHDDPKSRWPWLAHAALIAKHQLGDKPLARTYARSIRLQTVDGEVPSWARQMEIFLLEDMNELESARILIGALLEGGKIKDGNEIRFLKGRLSAIEAKLKVGK